MTANFKTGGENELKILKEIQPDRPLMVMEFWTGWFDHWLAEVHVTWAPESEYSSGVCFAVKARTFEFLFLA